MKKNDNLPDFTQLCPPEQNHSAGRLSLLIFYFFLCAVAGFLWEVGLFLVNEGDFANRGFLYGPWLPVYGVGAVIFYLMLSKWKSYPIIVFVFSMLIGTSVELLAGWLLDTIWDLRYWDYSSFPLNYKGYVCLWSALGFGIAGVLWICLLSNLFAVLWNRLPSPFRSGLNTLLVLLFLLDCTAALILPNVGLNITFS